MKTFAAAVVALIATAATAHAGGTLMSKCGPVRDSSGDCIALAHGGEMDAACMPEMGKEGPGKG